MKFLLSVCGSLVLGAIQCQAQATAPQLGPQQTSAQQSEDIHRKAEEQLKQQEHQRILGIFPQFNTSEVPDAVPLTAKQKFSLAFKGAVDPVTFAVAGLDAGISQWENDFPGYRQGAAGFGKRLGASYADSFDGTMIGNAFFPAILHEDPRYFRKGTGSVASRIWYAMTTTVRCKNDAGKWVPNYGNVMGNFAAGGISNLYYPSSDRGAGLTVQRALTVTAEGSLGALVAEFWPDIRRKVLHQER